MPLIKDNGESTSHFAFAARFAVMGNNIMCDSTAKQISAAISTYEACVVRFTHCDMINNVYTPYTYTRNEQVLNENGGIAGWKHIIYFGDNIRPIIINPIANTITLDPDWVAPAEPVDSVNGKTGAVVLTAEDVGAASTADFNETIIGLEVNGKIVTYIKGDGSRHSFETQDTDTTYSLATDEVTGLTKLYATIGSAEDGTMTQKAIKTELDKKVGVAVNANTLIFTI